MTPEKCESELDDISSRTPMVKSLLEALSKADAPVKREFFEVARCNKAVLGGFRPDEGVVLCHNNLTNRTDMENMLTHELIHAYDHCRCAGQAETCLSENRSPPASTPRPRRRGDPSYSRIPPFLLFSCRNKNMDWLDVKQHACSEVRASNLSGTATGSTRMFPRHPSFENGIRSAARRRAELHCDEPAVCREGTRRRRW